MKENTFYFIGFIVLCFFVGYLIVVFVSANIDKKYEQYEQTKQETIIDCVNRNNQLDWCLEKFNK